MAIDGASRLSYIELRSGLGAADCADFLARAVAQFDTRGIRVRRCSPTTAADTSASSKRPVTVRGKRLAQGRGWSVRFRLLDRGV